MENSPGSNRMLPITHTKRLTCARDKDFSHRHESTSSTTDQIPKMNYEKMRDEDNDDEEVYATNNHNGFTNSCRKFWYNAVIKDFQSENISAAGSSEIVTNSQIGQTYSCH